ncbi:MAG: hypothetical protein BYD32DRAFT_484029 [Podila humilis]|nr:MAG: hypothetical protein BYD32DRAFT_484029 [Podila humilis]
MTHPTEPTTVPLQEQDQVQQQQQQQQQQQKQEPCAHTSTTPSETVSSALPTNTDNTDDQVHSIKLIGHIKEAFSHNPTDDSFGPLPVQAGPNTSYLNERFLSY